MTAICASSISAAASTLLMLLMSKAPLAGAQLDVAPPKLVGAAAAPQLRQARAAVRATGRAAAVVMRETGTNPWDFLAEMVWETDDDLDLRVSDPTKCEIGYNSPLATSGGMLMEDIVPFCGQSSGQYKEMISYKLGGAVPGIYVINAQVFSSCGAPTEVTLTVKLGGVEVFTEVFTLNGRGDEREFFVHANRVDTVYGVKVDDRGECVAEGTGGVQSPPGSYGDYTDYY